MVRATIWKFPLTLRTPVAAETNGNAYIETDKARILKVLSFGVEGDTIVCWAAVQPEEGYRCSRDFFVVNTGDEALLDPTEHRTTVRVGEIVWHIFNAEKR